MSPNMDLFIVAGGMGGHSVDKVPGAIAVDLLCQRGIGNEAGDDVTCVLLTMQAGQNLTLSGLPSLPPGRSELRLS